MTAEVLNTDAEGRLVLADGLIEADNQNPNFIIDCATLTGAAKMAVGNDYHSVLSMDDDLVKNLSNQHKKKMNLSGVYHLKIFIAHKLIHLLQILLLVLFQLGRGQSTATAFYRIL